MTTFVEVVLRSLPMLCAALGASLVGFASGAVLAVWLGHTERSRQEIEVLRNVIRGYGWKDAEFAAALGVTEHQLSRIFAGREALNFHRLADLPEPFRAKWDAARAALRGARVYEREDLEFFRGLATLSRPEMLKMTLPIAVASMRKEG